MASLRMVNAWGSFAAIVLSIASFSRAAEFAGGAGEPSNPYQIATAEQLLSIGSDPNLLDKHFALVADIDLDPNLPGGRVFPEAVIAADIIRIIDPDPNLPRDLLSEQPMIVYDIIPRTGRKVVVEPSVFTGSFDGKGHVVTRLTISDASTIRGVGLFGTIGASGRVQDLGLVNASIKGTYGVGGLTGHNAGTILRCHVAGQVGGSQYVGGLVGGNIGTIAMSHTAGTVSGGDEGNDLGGLVGQNSDGGTIANCYSDAVVRAGHSNRWLGALVGNNIGSISTCHATGALSAGDGTMLLGGFAGDNMGSIANCCTTASVRCGQASMSAGGFVGANVFGTVANSYATGRVEAGYASKYIGGFLGHGGLVGDVSHCFWDREASGMLLSEGGVGLTTSEMQNAQRYLAEGWDWVGERTNGTADVWLIPEAGGYPQLAAFHDQVQGYLQKGSGTQNDPYRILTVEDIGAMSRGDPSAYYRLEADLDMSGIVWTSAPMAGFDGTFEGAEHVISNLNVRGGGHLGLFGILGSRATVRDVTMRDANVVGSGPTYSFGALAGDSLGSISSCHATGIVSGWNSVGGLVGSNHWGKIVRSHAAVDILNGDFGCGGFAGVNGGDIIECFATGRVSGAREAQKVGGFVGYNTGDILNSYARGNVSGEAAHYLGGFVGHNELLSLLVNCYTTGAVSSGKGGWNVGPFVGKDEGGISLRWRDFEDTINNCYFVRTVDTAEPAPGAGLPLTEEQMRRQSSFVGWDFDGVWMICEGKDYPRLQWERVQCQP